MAVTTILMGDLIAGMAGVFPSGTACGSSPALTRFG